MKWLYYSSGCLWKKFSKYKQYNNPFLLNEKGARVYFTTVPPFKPDQVISMTLSVQAPLLISVVMSFSGGPLEYPIKQTEEQCRELVLKDLAK